MDGDTYNDAPERDFARERDFGRERDDLTAASVEVARVYLMADYIRHAARAFAGTWSLDEHAALRAIVDGVGEELRDQLNSITTFQQGSLD